MVPNTVRLLSSQAMLRRFELGQSTVIFMYRKLDSKIKVNSNFAQSLQSYSQCTRRSIWVTALDKWDLLS
jgi:hypothetical protein